MGPPQPIPVDPVGVNTKPSPIEKTHHYKLSIVIIEVVSFRLTEMMQKYVLQYSPGEYRIAQ
jgi:hypothetical protein